MQCCKTLYHCVFQHDDVQLLWWTSLCALGVPVAALVQTNLSILSIKISLVAE